MINQANADIALEIEALPDGVRYLLPRRRRRGWVALIWHAMVALFVYFTVPTFLVWLVVYHDAPGWFLLVALGTLLVLIGGLRNIRDAVAILTIPDVAIELRIGRMIATRRALVGTSTHEVPLTDLRRFSVRSLIPEHQFSKSVESRQKPFWRRWFSTHPLDQMDRADRRKQEVLRFFGSLVLEGDDGAEIALADEYGRIYLTRLAEDLAQRINREKPAVAVEQDSPWPAAFAADDPRLNRPGQITNIKIHRTADSFVFEVPPPGVSYAPIVGGVVFGPVAIFMAGCLMHTLSAPPGPQDLCVLYFMGSMLLAGIYAARVGLNAALVGITRTVIVTRAGCLTVRFERPIGSRKRQWRTGETAACLIEEWATKDKTGKAVLVYDLIVLDHALRGVIVLRARPEAELEWVAAVIHKELGLGAPRSVEQSAS